MGKMLVISFKDNKDEKVFHEVVNLLEQYQFQPMKEIKYQPVLIFDDFVVDPQALSVKKDDRLLDFNYREFSLLYLLVSHKVWYSNMTICMRFYGASIICRKPTAVLRLW